MGSYPKIGLGVVRVDKTSVKASSLDVVRMLLKCDAAVANNTLRRLFTFDEGIPSIESRITCLQINGFGPKTPVADLRTQVETIWKLPGLISTTSRRQSVETVCRIMGGGLDVMREIEQHMSLVHIPPEAELGQKTSIIRKALCGVDTVFGGLRIDKTSGKASSIDVVRIVLKCSSSSAGTSLGRLFAQDDCIPSIKSRTAYIRINGFGNKTPVTDLKTILEMIWKLPGRTSANFRRKSAETMCRFMGGDLALLREIEQNNLTWRSVEGGRAIQQALIEPIEYKEVEKSTRVKECSVRDALASLVGGEAEVETPAGSIDVLSGTEVIEVKYYKQWKHGLGQVLAYHSFYPSLAKRLHLFAHIGEVGTRKYFELAKSVCDAHVVRVTFEEVADLGDGPPRVKRARVENE